MAEDLDVVKSGLLMSSNLGTRCDEPTRWMGERCLGWRRLTMTLLSNESSQQHGGEQI